MYGSHHAVMAKYFSFICLQESIEDKTEALSFLRLRVFDFLKGINKKTGASENHESLFMLEAYYD